MDGSFKSLNSLIRDVFAVFSIRFSVTSKEYEIKDGFTAYLGSDLDYSLESLAFMIRDVLGCFSSRFTVSSEEYTFRKVCAKADARLLKKFMSETATKA
mgnify:FL=1